MEGTRDRAYVRKQSVKKLYLSKTTFLIAEVIMLGLTGVEAGNIIYRKRKGRLMVGGCPYRAVRENSIGGWVKAILMSIGFLVSGERIGYWRCLPRELTRLIALFPAKIGYNI